MHHNQIMKKTIFALTLIASTLTYAEDYETGGGYDPLAGEKAEKAARERKAAEDYKLLQIENERAAALKAKQKKEFAKRKAEKEKRELLPENIALLKEHEVCVKAGKNANSDNFSKWIAELNRRGTKYDELSIRNKQIKINGFECDIFAAFGLPKRYNRTVNARGTSIQFVYDNSYIYTDNGVITSWSD